MSVKIILFNGPPRSGKDTTTDELQRALVYASNVVAHKYKFAGPMKRALKAFFDLSDEDFIRLFETKEKDVPQDCFFGLTGRQVLISFSEDWAKKLFGKEVMGLLAGQQIKSICERYKNHEPVFVISDCGFPEELEGLAKFYDKDKMVIYRLKRDGTSYEGDSRNWILDDEVLLNRELDNNRPSDEVVVEILDELRDL